MDSCTLNTFKDFIGRQPKPYTNCSFIQLLEKENECLQSLYLSQGRLEQEKIDIKYLQQQLDVFLG
jgi:hypothetical protein